MEIIVQLMNVLAWPITVLIVAYMFRAELRTTLSRLTHLKFRDLEASFQEHLRSVEKELKKLPSPSAEKSMDGGGEQFIGATAISPRATIMESWIGIEQAITALAERLPITEPGRRTTYKLMRELGRRGYVTDGALAAYDNLRTLRNEAAHAAGFSLSKEDAERYELLSSELVSYIDRVGLGERMN